MCSQWAPRGSGCGAGRCDSGRGSKGCSTGLGWEGSRTGWGRGTGWAEGGSKRPLWSLQTVHGCVLPARIRHCLLGQAGAGARGSRSEGPARSPRPSLLHPQAHFPGPDVLCCHWDAPTSHPPASQVSDIPWPGLVAWPLSSIAEFLGLVPSHSPGRCRHFQTQTESTQGKFLEDFLLSLTRNAHSFRSPVLEGMSGIT